MKTQIPIMFSTPGGCTSCLSDSLAAMYVRERQAAQERTEIAWVVLAESALFGRLDMELRAIVWGFLNDMPTDDIAQLVDRDSEYVRCVLHKMRYWLTGLSNVIDSLSASTSWRN